MTPADVLAALRSGDFDAISAHGDHSFRADVSPQRMRDVWMDAASRWGVLVDGDSDAAFLLHDVPLRFTGGDAHLQVTYRGGRIAGLVLKPGPPTARFGE